MSNVSVLTTREIVRIMNQKRTVYLSYLVTDKFVSQYDEKSVLLLREYYKRQKRSWSQLLDDGQHSFVVEYNHQTYQLSVFSNNSRNLYYITHGTFDLSDVGDATRAYFLAALYVCEYENRLDQLIAKLRLVQSSGIDDDEFSG